MILASLGTLGIGEFFQLVGGWQHLMEALNSLVIDGEMASAVNYSICADIPSCLLAFFVSKDLSGAQIVYKTRGRSRKLRRRGCYKIFVYRNVLKYIRPYRTRK